MMSNNENLFSTSDLPLSAVIALSIPLEVIDKTNPARAKFIFKRTPSLDELIQSYWRKQLVVEPQAYFLSLKTLKNRLYSSA